MKQQTVVLHATRDDIGARITGTASGPVPTVTINAGPHISVEFDPTNLGVPVAIDIWSLHAADTDLRDLIGSTLVDQIWALPISELAAELRDFVPTKTWEGLAALAIQLWNDRWNVFPLDPRLTVVDKLAASSSAGPFGAQIARESLSGAIPALTELKARQDQGQLAPLASDIVNESIRAARTALPAPSSTLSSIDNTPMSLVMLLESRIPSTQSGAVDAGMTVLSDSDGSVERLIETADWRLTGMGMASTAEGMLQAEYVRDSVDIIRMSIPAQEPIPAENRTDEPYYQGTVTDAINGELLAFVHLGLNVEGTAFEGKGPLARPLKQTDIIDIRHPLLNEPVQRNLGLRQIDKVRRTAARAYAVGRLATTAGEPPAEVVEMLEKSWGIVAKEASLLQREFKQFRETAKGWINVAEAHQRRILAASPNLWQRERALDFEEDQLPDLTGRKELPATLGELGFTGHLYQLDQTELG